MNNRTLAVLQARMSSTRLPGKVMKEINGRPMIYWQIQRILKANRVNKLVVVTSTDSSDDPLARFLQGLPVNVHRGSLDNVFSRFIEVTEKYPHDALVRLTGDCPLVMPELLDAMIEKFYSENVDYLSNTLIPTFPDGLDIEIIKFGGLGKLNTFNLKPEELEHVTYGIYQRPETFKLFNFLNSSDQSLARWTVDYLEDLDFVRAIFGEFRGRETEFNYRQVTEFLELHPKVRSQISGLRRNEMLQSRENQG